MRDAAPSATSGAHSLQRYDDDRRALIERADSAVVALASAYPDGHHVAAHRHGRSQLLHVRAGVVLAVTDAGRWMVPAGQALWIPAGITHAVDMLGGVRMQSAYVRPAAIAGLPASLRVVAMTALMRSLMGEAVAIGDAQGARGRDALLLDLILHEIPRLAELPLGLPFPSDRRFAALCRRYLDAPTPAVTIDDWARETGMSRRSFTRRFQRETGLSLSVWRQQASLFAALPRLFDGEPITTVALDLGYDSVAAFTTMFKRMLGTSPRAYLSVNAPAVS
ncbi:AraC family transcriptional regulator [Nitratireductor alexandrii]|uniref:AraC family transcriptional regulator n=1 Tax=Nitratireductor alexandrii TaxID=2448161 RepID=UPI000FD7E513|nr:helix-turn-helix transcriptional regulator [Nitratireductor alexandrii]